MLAELRVKNFVLIDSLALSFGSGLNVLSGETGAGKSIVLDALNLLLGGKGSPELLREGTDEALIEGLFVLEHEPWIAERLEQLGLEPTDELWIRRTLSRNGRGRVFLNGGPAVLASLRTLAGGLVDFSSQNEHQVLLNPDTHLDILDAYGDLRDLVDRYRSQNTALTEVLGERRALLEKQRLRSEREEFLRFQLTELERVNVRAGEDDELEAERRLLAHAEKLHNHAQQLEQSLYSGREAVVDVLGSAVQKLQEIAAIDSEQAAQLAQLQGALFAIEDVARTMGTYARKVRFDPRRLDEIQTRLAELTALKRKYRLDLAGIAARRLEMKTELNTLAGAEERLESLEPLISCRWKELRASMQELTRARCEAARRLESMAQEEQRSLSMPRARFAIDISARHELGDVVDDAHVPGPSGNDRVEFMFSANQGEPLRPLAKVASGGELSRVLLALKRALAGAGEVGTFVFDEIDSGIGGAVAEVVGRKLREISSHRQLLCITHLPQIAAYADRHYIVEKEIAQGRTVTRVQQLDDTGRVEEIARMLGGLEITARTREHAREMIERCAAYQPAQGEVVCQSSE